MSLKIYVVVFLICVQVIACDENENENDESTFVPTHEWKTVKKGQKVPEGLYIRINLETGVTEAKLLDKNEKTENNNALSITPTEDGPVPEQDLKISPSELKEALKFIKNDMKEEEIKNKYRTYDDLKKDFDELNVKQKTDAEIIKELIEKHADMVSRNDIDEEEILTILEDLEYLVHQYDNANDFVTLNGLKDVVYKNLNSTSSEIKRETLKLLGASIQNNVMVKIKALDSGCIDILLRLIVLEKDSSVKYRALFALGGLLRSFPYAQLKFIENAGLSVFSKLFEMENLKIQMKTLTIITDLLQEEKISLKEDNVSYDINLSEQLLKNNYCDVLNKLLVNSITIESNDHDIIEKCLEALYVIIGKCKGFLTPKSKDILVSLRNMYRKLSDREKENADTDSYIYYSVLYDLSNNIVKEFQVNKDEL